MTTAAALAITTSNVQAAYIAYFGRPADPAGLNFWTTAGTADTTMLSIMRDFAASPEFAALYGDATGAAFVNAVYQNVFGRDADAGGLNFYANALAAGTISYGDVVYNIVAGASGTDKTIVDNKVAYATQFTTDLAANVQAYVNYTAEFGIPQARAQVATIGATAASLTAALAAEANTLAAIAAGPAPAPLSLSFTTGVDKLVGGFGNDVFTAVLDGANSTLTPLDSADGAAGTGDTINIDDLDVAGSTFPAGLTITNIEKAVIRGAGALNVNTSTWTGLETASVTKATTASITAAKTTAVEVSGATGNITINGGSSATVTAATADQAVTIGTTTVGAGAVTVTHSKQGAGQITIDGGTTVSVTASAVTTGTIIVGQGPAATDLPTGAITVKSTGAASAAANSWSLGDIYTDGGTTVSVTQVATSSDAAAAEDTTGATISQSDVFVDGGSKTTSVTVVQTAAQDADPAVLAVAAKFETQVVNFKAMAPGDTVVIDGLTFTASKALTAAQAAAAFANLAKSSVQGAAPAANGVYTGTLSSNWASGAVTSSGSPAVYSVTFTAATASSTDLATLDVDNGTDAADPTLGAHVRGVSKVTGVTGVLGIDNGFVEIDDASYGTATANTIASVTVDGYDTSDVVIRSSALTSLSLANGADNSGVHLLNGTATTLALTVNNLGAGNYIHLDDGSAKYSTLNITTAGADSALDVDGSAVTSLTVSGSNALDLTGSGLGALKTVSVSGAAGVKLDASGGTVTSVDASASSGANTFSVDATKATYTGGSGVDKVTLTTVAPSKAVSLGAGNDTLTLAAGTSTSTANLAGGDGTDTLVMAAADAILASATDTFATKIDSFEKLSLGAASAAGTVNLANLDAISYVISAGGTAKLTLDKFAEAGTVELTAGNSGDTKVVLADATGTANTFNVVAKLSGDTSFGNVDVAGVETINLTATDTTATTINTATISLVDAAAKSVVISGNANVTLTTNSVVLTSVDGSAMTGKLTAGTNGTVAQTIKGGAGADTLTANGNGDVLTGGAGADTLIAKGNLVQLTGGAGADKFDVSDVTTNVNSYATITDLAAGDLIKFSAGAADFMASKVVLADTAVFQDYANAAIALTNDGDVSWFQFGGNTYIVENVAIDSDAILPGVQSLDNETTFTNGQDIIVKIAGLVDLTSSSFSGTADLLLVGPTGG